MQQQENGWKLLKWELVTSAPVDDVTIDHLITSLPRRDGIILEIQALDSQRFDLLVTFNSGITSYKESWDITFLALRVLESQLGELFRIQGIPRNDWKYQFVINTHVMGSIK